MDQNNTTETKATELPDFPIGFFIHMEEGTKNKLLKQFIDLLWTEKVSMVGMPEDVKLVFLELVKECEKAVESANYQVEVGTKMNREQRRKMEKKERSSLILPKDQGLVLLGASDPSKKLIVEP